MAIIAWCRILYYRDGKISYARRNADGKMVSFDTLPEALQEEMRSHSAKRRPADARAPISRAILDFCRSEPVDAGPGRLGRFLPGRPLRAFYAAQEFPERFRANASLHGTWLVSDAPDSPHRLAQLMRGEIYCGYGEHDRFATPDVRGRACSGRSAAAAIWPIAAMCMPAPATATRCPIAISTTLPRPRSDWREIFAMFERQLGARKQISVQRRLASARRNSMNAFTTGALSFLR